MSWTRRPRWTRQPAAPLRTSCRAASAARATEVIKDISKVFKVKIAKLYAKHFKVHEQVKMLQEKIVIGVGTPNRLNKLIEVGALSLAETEILVIDSHKDSKNFTILTLPEVKNDLYNFLRGNVAKDLRSSRSSS